MSSKESNKSLLPIQLQVPHAISFIDSIHNVYSEAFQTPYTWRKIKIKNAVCVQQSTLN